MKLKASKKAWKIDYRKVQDGDIYYDNVPIVYAESIGKARSEFFKEGSIFDYNLGNGDLIEFINIPCIRSYENDIFIINNEQFTLTQYIEIMNNEKIESERNKILSDKDVTHCYIKKRQKYYKYNYNGYSNHKSEAGVYKKTEAINHALCSGIIEIVPINTKEHNQFINEKIEALIVNIIK